MTVDYKETLNLPATDFPMKANLAQMEPRIIEEWNNKNLYAVIRKKRKASTKYILHDGPPYANGNIHQGHALNKVLKDLVIKIKTMEGFNAPYVPGWDCHGLPIEHQVDKKLGSKKNKMTKSEIRKECREYAQKFVDIQREEFKRLGILGEWDNPYLTMSYAYEAQIVRELGSFFEKGAIYRGLKPIHWCPSCRTALAEAEVEHDTHSSPSIYVKFPLTSDKKNRFSCIERKKTYLVIWTTTPWTLPANLAVATNPNFKYSIAETEDSILVIASDLLSISPSKDGQSNLPPDEYHIQANEGMPSSRSSTLHSVLYASLTA
jgi:isoleucyl-tRNA synthetase